MKKLLIPFFLFFFLAFTLSIKLAYAVDEVSLADWPTYLATQLGIDVFSAGIMASGIIMALFLFPTFILTRGKNTSAELMVGGIALSLSIALGWLPIWIFAIIILLIAFGFASTISKHIGG